MVAEGETESTDVKDKVMSGTGAVVVEARDASATDRACDTGGRVNVVEAAILAEVCEGLTWMPVSGIGSGIEVVSAETFSIFFLAFPEACFCVPLIKSLG